MTSWPDHLPSGNQNRFWRNGDEIDAAFIFAGSDFVTCVEIVDDVGAASFRRFRKRR